MIAVWNVMCKEYINMHNLLKSAMNLLRIAAVWNMKCKEYINMHNLLKSAMILNIKSNSYYVARIARNLATTYKRAK